MKRGPLVATFILFIALCVSAAFWAMQLFKPPVRAVAAVPQVAQTVVPIDAAASLFGGKAVEVVVASNFQLTGVVVAPDPKDSIAILVTDTKPPQAVKVNAEIIPGVMVKEVFKSHVLLQERGVVKRVDLPDVVKLLGPASLLQAPLPVVLDSRIQTQSSRSAAVVQVPSQRVSASNTLAPPARPADGRAASAASMRNTMDAMRGAQAQQQQAQQTQQAQQPPPEQEYKVQLHRAPGSAPLSPQMQQRSGRPATQ